MPLWPFQKKTPTVPLSLNRNFYLSVLSAAQAMPPLLQIINPDGSNGAVRGFGAPLALDASKDMLNVPLRPGAYALTTTDKLTIVQMDVFPRNEVPQFQLPNDAIALQAANLSGEKLNRAMTASYLTNFVLRGYDHGVYVSVQFFLDCARRLADISDGVIADALAETYRAPEEMRLAHKLDLRIDFREIGSIKIAKLADGFWISTRGLVKFNLPEFEMYGVPETGAETAAKMAIVAAQQALIGLPLKEGETAFAPAEPLHLVGGTRSRDEWGDRPTLELRDKNGSGAAKGVEAWARAGG